MNDLMVKEDIESMIYEVRGKYVILDSDIAKLFGVETKRINETVRNNIDEFSNYIFRISEEEFLNLRFQNVTSNDNLKSILSTSSLEKNYGGSRKGHTAFTREGVAVLGSIMRGEKVRYAVEKILYTFDKLENKNSLIIKDKNIQDMIYEINGIQVILDSDLAYLYECKNGTKEINQAVKNNLEKFPERFSWVLTDEEKSHLWSKFLTAKNSNMSRSNPRVFTEQGVVMLATILHTNVAIDTSIKIVDAFVAMRHYFSYIALDQKHINNLVLEHDDKIKLLEETLDSFKNEEASTSIYFDGHIYDAYSKILHIFNQAKESLIVIDSYADNTLLDMISKLEIEVILITTNKYIDDTIIEKYNSQYNNLKVVYDNTYHDRFFVLDNKTIYHCGSSINRIGYKTFAINKVNDKESIDNLLNKINKII